MSLQLRIQPTPNSTNPSVGKSSKQPTSSKKKPNNQQKKQKQQQKQQQPQARQQSSRASAGGLTIDVSSPGSTSVKASSRAAKGQQQAGKRAFRMSHGEYNRTWVLARAPAHLPPPKPAYNGTEGTHRYIHYSVDTNPTAHTIPAGGRAVLFWDDNDQCASLAHGGFLNTKLTAATDYNSNVLLKDEADLRTGDYVRSVPPASTMQVRGLCGPFLTGSGSSLDSVTFADEGPKVQRLFCRLSCQVSVPFGGMCQTSIIAPGLNPHFCGDRSRRVFRDSNDSALTEPDRYLRPVYRVPNTASGENWEGAYAGYGSVMTQMGASDTASMSHEVVLQPTDGWHTPGRETLSIGTFAGVGHGCHPSNMMYFATQGSILIYNTGTDPVSIIFKGTAKYAVTRLDIVNDNANPLVMALLQGSPTLETNPLVQTGDAALHSRSKGSAVSRPPVENTVAQPNHDTLESGIESGAVGYAAMQAAEHYKVWDMAKAAASKVGSGIESIGAKFGRTALPVLEDAAAFAPRLLPFL